MKFVFCYDISDEKKLQKIAKKMEKYGVRVQYSIFEVDTTFSNAKKILKELEKIMDKETDRIYVYPIEEDDFSQAIRIGRLENINVI